MGSRCTNAVAINTPVPKCLDMKRNRRGIGRRGKRRARTGKEQAIVIPVLAMASQRAERSQCIPNVLSPRMRNSAITCNGVLYFPRCLDPHAGVSSEAPPRRRSSARKRASGISEIAERARFKSTRNIVRNCPRSICKDS